MFQPPSPFLSSVKTNTMKSYLFATLLLTTAANAQDGWTSLFDGTSLEGWTQRNGTATYKVVDGTILGTTTEGSPNSFLASNKEYGDFELEFEVKVDDALNSGVQLRSTDKPVTVEGTPEAKGKAKGKKAAGDRVNGPQCEIEASPGQAGYIYGEATGLGWLSQEPNSKDPAKSQHSHMKNGEWNSYRIIAKGPRIQTFINGQPVADLTHEAIYKSHPKGFIALQVHGIKAGTGPFSVAWRNIRIKE
jgi:hypothetical protein